MRYSVPTKTNSLLLKIASWFTRIQYGKEIAPMRVIYSRKPALIMLANEMDKFQERKISLSHELKLLVKTYASMLNGCEFCRDLSLAKALKKNLGEARFASLADFDSAGAGLFTPAERAALSLVKDYALTRTVSDDTFARVNDYFSENEVVEIVLLNAFEHFFNALNIPFQIESDGLADLQRKRLLQVA